jgi:recombinational DNA repair ATPase RecF
VQPARQVVLTAADLSMFTDSFRQQASIWHVQAGTITTES